MATIFEEKICENKSLKNFEYSELEKKVYCEINDYSSDKSKLKYMKIMNSLLELYNDVCIENENNDIDINNKPIMTSTQMTEIKKLTENIISKINISQNNSGMYNLICNKFKLNYDLFVEILQNFNGIIAGGCLLAILEHGSDFANSNFGDIDIYIQIDDDNDFNKKNMLFINK